MRLQRVGSGFAEEGPLFYAWDEDLVCLKEWSAELESASPRRERPPRRIESVRSGPEQRAVPEPPAASGTPGIGT